MLRRVEAKDPKALASLDWKKDSRAGIMVQHLFNKGETKWIYLS